MSKEAIEALESARAHILDAYRIWQADDVSAVPPPKSGAGAVIAKIDAVLSSPIAGEGKVPEGWQLVPKVGTMVKANHPITCLNPEEWFAVAEIEHRHGKFYVRGENTCWFSVSSLLHMSLNVQP